MLTPLPPARPASPSTLGVRCQALPRRGRGGPITGILSPDQPEDGASQTRWLNVTGPRSAGNQETTRSATV